MLVTYIGLHPKCEKCPHILFDQICDVRLEPWRQWSKLPVSGCAMKPKEVVDPSAAFKLNPLKASKRRARR